MRTSKGRKIVWYQDGYYVYWSENGNGKRHSLHTTELPTAERNFQEYLRQIQLPAETIKDITEEWIADKTLSHEREIRSKLKPIHAFFGNLRPEQITRALCREYKKQRGVADTTVRNELAILRCAIRWKDPHTKAIFELPTPAPPRESHINKGQYHKLIKACAAPHIELFIVLAWGTAARTTALLELKWESVDFERRLINLGVGQANKGRARIPMTNTVYEALKEAYGARTCDYVIEYNSGRVKSIRNGFTSTARRAGLKVAPHDMRRSAAIKMAEAGVPMEEIAQYLGHSNASITYKAYARYSPEYLRRAAAALDG